MKIVVIFLVLLSLTGCTKKLDTSETPNFPENKISDIERFKSDYSNENNSIKVTIDDNDSVKYVTSTEALSLLTSGTGIVYFGRPTCPWCRNVVPVILEAARNNNLTVNYLNPGDLSDDQMDDYVKVKQVLDPYLESDEDGNKRFYIPDVYFVKDGKIVGHHLSTVDSQNDAYVPLSKNQKNELITIYNNYIDLIK